LEQRVGALENRVDVLRGDVLGGRDAEQGQEAAERFHVQEFTASTPSGATHSLRTKIRNPKGGQSYPVRISDFGFRILGQTIRPRGASRSSVRSWWTATARPSCDSCRRESR